ncbi:hypothetical protein AA0114_g3710 [Alternaria tenuissima]|jgi:hypothetical protein|uniref:Uncharacterized protein n=1 Tax=Alternaria tenuissima TaxID=119927 RepID=A0A4Q4MM49_9PLEO|nr:hypothetical protein AA0114_g3710 [Alternaria tenuissima]
MTAHAASTARAPQPSKTTTLSDIRPVHNEVEYDSEAETLVGNESDDDDNAHLASANDQPAASHGTAGWPSTNEPGEPIQNNIDESIRVQKAKETEDAVGRSLSLIAGARRKRDEGKSSLLQ